MEKHFEAITKSGRNFNFGKRCNNISCEEHICLFKYVCGTNKKSELLGAIPYSNIEAIFSVDDNT